MRADYQLLRRNLTQVLHRQEWMAQMVEHAQEHHDVEPSNRRHGQLRHVYDCVLHVEPECRAGEVKGLLFPPPLTHPAVMVGRKHATGAALLGLETVATIPRANVKHGIVWLHVTEDEVGLLHQDVMRAMTLRDHSATEINRVEPVSSCHLGSEIKRRRWRGQGSVVLH